MADELFLFFFFSQSPAELLIDVVMSTVAAAPAAAAWEYLLAKNTQWRASISSGLGLPGSSRICMCVCVWRTVS